MIQINFDQSFILLSFYNTLFNTLGSIDPSSVEYAYHFNNLLTIDNLSFL